LLDLDDFDRDLAAFEADCFEAPSLPTISGGYNAFDQTSTPPVWAWLLSGAGIATIQDPDDAHTYEEDLIVASEEIFETTPIKSVSTTGSLVFFHAADVNDQKGLRFMNTRSEGPGVIGRLESAAIPVLFDVIHLRDEIYLISAPTEPPSVTSVQAYRYVASTNELEPLGGRVMLPGAMTEASKVALAPFRDGFVVLEWFEKAGDNDAVLTPFDLSLEGTLPEYTRRSRSTWSRSEQGIGDVEVVAYREGCDLVIASLVMTGQIATEHVIDIEFTRWVDYAGGIEFD